jgi:hypothetical protein
MNQLTCVLHRCHTTPDYAVVWCGVMCCGVVWCGVVWCGVVWCGVVWRGVAWRGVAWRGVAWCGVVWCDVVWCDVVWCGVVWCGVVWCGVAWCAHAPHSELSVGVRTLRHFFHLTGPLQTWRRPQGLPMIHADHVFDYRLLVAGSGQSCKLMKSPKSQ